MTHASLFSGIGAPEIAAEMLGWENAFHCEINPFGRKVLEYWFPKSKSYENIITTDFREWNGKIDIPTGGFPCQPFSFAGKRKGAEDDRYLWPQMLRAINEIRPTWVIGENVNGITTMVEQSRLSHLGSETSLFGEDSELHGYELRFTYTIERICKDLERAGYSVQPIVIPACAVGAPHRRDRVFFLAYNVADTNRSNDLRESRKYEGEGRKERIQERNEIREFRKPSDVRPTNASDASDTKSKQGNGVRPIFEECSQSGETQFRGNNSTLDSRGRDIADTCSKGLEGENESRCCERGKRMQIRGNLARYSMQNLQPQKRWESFPSVSPIHRGNDGLPFDVDNLTLSFGEWRTESLKAYGNAIVPQVMYSIFKCIDQISV